LEIAKRGIVAAAESLPPMAHAVNLFQGEVTNKPVADTFAMPYCVRFVK
jgi:alanine dehydrogenase